MGKTIKIKEDNLIVLKDKLNEITAGSSDIVSHNDVSAVKLYHGTTIDALLMIMESGVMSAKRGKQHGETYGVNWFSLKNGDNFNKGALFSIEVPGDVFNEMFRMMNNSEALSKDEVLDVTSFNLTIEKICGLSREAIKNAYDRNVSKGERYPLESTGYLFDHFIEKVQDDDVLFPSILYHNWDKYYPMIMKNILGNNINESVAKEFAPVAEIGAEPNSPVGCVYSHMKQEEKVSDESVNENVEKEVESSEVDLSSFKKKDSLPPGIWKDEETLNSKVRLKLLDIADDFWNFVNLTWVEPKGIIITGSICNFNWSKFSDIDLHLVVDFNEIDEKTEFVKQYLDSKKNEWNTEHEGLKIMGYPVELYTQDVSDNVEAGGIYDLEENAWIRRPNPHTIKNIGLEKFGIKDKAAEIMTIIDDMYKTLSSTDDEYEVSKIGEDAHYLWDKVKDLRKKSLTKRGENGAGNIVYKVLRRTGYLDKLFKLFSVTYDKSNSISESAKKYLKVLKEEFAMDGSSEGNPYEKRWKAEREALKNFVANYGKLMQSKEDNKQGRLYKVYYDETMSNLIGYNYCICVQWDEMKLKPKSTVYIRALDKFTPFIRRNLQFDNRGMDNQRGTWDDTGYSQRIESKKKDSIIEGIDELNIYHSSYSNFNKFNHKKYMSSGAGSQTFGWGTYLTDSYPIAVDYAKKFIYYKFNEFVVAAEPEQYIYNAESYDQEIITEAVKLYKSVVRTRMCFTWGLDNKYNRNFFDSFFETDDEDPGNRYDSVLEEYNRYKEIFKKYFSELAERVGEEEAENRIKNAFEVSNGKYGYIMKQTKDDYVSEQNHRNTVNNLVKTIINNIWDAADANVKKESYIYEVEIPDDNGINYIDYNNPLSQKALTVIENGITNTCRRFKLDLWQAMKKWEELLEYRNNQPRGKEVYDEIIKIIGLHASKGKAEKAASLFLMQCGFDGIKYKAGSIYGLPEGAADNSLNYVIFDSNKIRITSKNLFTEAF